MREAQTSVRHQCHCCHILWSVSSCFSQLMLSKAASTPSIKIPLSWACRRALSCPLNLFPFSTWPDNTQTNLGEVYLVRMFEKLKVQKCVNFIKAILGLGTCYRFEDHCEISGKFLEILRCGDAMLWAAETKSTYSEWMVNCACIYTSLSRLEPKPLWLLIYSQAQHIFCCYCYGYI